jgi:murein DD-endopeptidase MepM/ murein hydrolase activator NlpD
VKNWWIILGLLGFLGYLPFFPPEMRLLNLFFLMPLVASLWRSLFRRRNPEVRPRPVHPLPPPAGGILPMAARYIAAQLLLFVVPSMRRQIMRQIRGNASARARVVDDTALFQQRARYRLPFDGEWYVENGGVTEQTSHSWDVAAQRYAYDFVVVDDRMRRWRTDGRTVEDYLCYGLPILAPADGEVVSVVDGVRDAPGVGTGWIDVFTPHFPGNVVVIKHADSEYSLMAHLVPGSIRVAVGDWVKQGQEIGRCGNSGFSSEPHLHFQVHDRADFFEAAGLPIAFDNVSVDGAPAQDGVYIERYTRLRHEALGPG